MEKKPRYHAYFSIELGKIILSRLFKIMAFCYDLKSSFLILIIDDNDVA